MTNILLNGLLFVAIGFVILWIYSSVKAYRNPTPEQEAANELGMSILRYRKYVEADRQIQEIYLRYGLDSATATRLVAEVIDKLPNKNEWRRFMEHNTVSLSEQLRKDMTNEK